MHHKKFAGGDYSNKFPQNVNRMRTMVGPGADMSFVGGDYSNKFPQNVNRMRRMLGPGADMSFKGGDYSNKFPQNAKRMSTLIGPGADMSFVGGAYSDKFAVPASHTNEQAGFSRANNMGHGGTLNDSNSYFYMNHHDSFNPRGNHSNAAGARQLGGGPFTAGLTFGKKSMRSSADRISVNPVGGVERQTGDACSGERCGSAYIKGCPVCGCSDKARGHCTIGGGGGFTSPGARGYSNEEIAQEIRKSGKKVPSNFFNKYPRKSAARKMNASGCGYNNFHHKSSFSSNINKYNTFR